MEKSPAAVALAEPAKRSSTVSTASVLPPRRADLQARVEKALYFADPASERVKRLTPGAFQRVRPARAADDGD